MKPHPRIRKTAKWGGAVVCVVLIVAWVVSGWWWTGCISSRRSCALVHGCIIWVDQMPADVDLPLMWRIDPIQPAPSYNWSIRKRTAPGLTATDIPLWIPLLPTLLITAAAWRLDTLARWRADVTKCPKCRYDRTGLAADAVCPECGAAAPAQIVKT